MGNIVHMIDCMDFMRDKPDKAYDLAIVDPPYGIGAGDYKRAGTQHGHSKAICKKYHNYNDKCPDKIYFDTILKISNKQIIWGANHFINKIPYASSCWIVWDKDNGQGSGYADCELAWTSFNTAVRRIRYRWSGMLQEKMGLNKEYRLHPNQKPVALYKWLLTNYAKPGQTIFDSHVGSGSIRIACHDLGFDFEGCEKDKDYWEAQEKRYQDHIAQQELFPKEEIQAAIFKENDLEGYTNE